MNIFELVVYGVIIIFFAVIPSLLILSLGVYIAGEIGLTGIIWWIFLIIFYIVIVTMYTKLF